MCVIIYFVCLCLCVTFACMVRNACLHKINEEYSFSCFFFLLPLVRYINLIYDISEKTTDSQRKIVHPQSPWVHKKNKILSCQSMFLIFLCFCLSPSSPPVLWKPQQANTHYILCALELGRANGDKLGW